MAAKLTRIYGLIDPRTTELRYVGKTIKSIQHRLHQHVGAGRRAAKQRVSRWIRGILADGYEPEAFEIEAVPCGESWQDAEVFWISYFRSVGCRLTNLTDGGEGCSGFVQSTEVREFIARRNSDPKFVEKVVYGIRRHRCENPKFWNDHYAARGEKNKDPEFIQKSTDGFRLACANNPEIGRKIGDKKREWWADNDNRESVAEKVRESYTPERIAEYKSMAVSWMAKRKEIYERCLSLAASYEAALGIPYVMPANVTQHSTSFWRETESKLIAANDNKCTAQKAS